MGTAREPSSQQRSRRQGERSAPTGAAARWDADTERLVSDWHNRAAAASEAHYELAHRCRRRNVALGVPVVVASAVVGTSLFATLNETAVDSSVRLAIGALSVAASVLAALQTFPRFAERAERHVLAADWYAAVRRGAAEVLALPGTSREPPTEYLPRLRKEMSRIGQQGPEIPAPLWARVAASHGIDDTPPARTVLDPPAPPGDVPEAGPAPSLRKGAR